MIINRSTASTVLLIASIILLVESAFKSLSILLTNVYLLNLNAAALGILSTLTPTYFIGLTAAALALILGNNVIKGVSTIMLLMYLVGYPLLLSPYPPYLPDGTLYAGESLAVYEMGYLPIKGFLYNGGAYPLAFLIGAVLHGILGVGAINISAAYGLLEPIILGLVAYSVATRLSDSKWHPYVGLLAILMYIALIWSYQFHFSPQDLNIVLLMSSIPLFIQAVKSNVKAFGLLTLLFTALIVGHQTEAPILLASSLALLVSLVMSSRRPSGPLTMYVALNSALISVMWVTFNNYVFPANNQIVFNVFSSNALERLINLILGRLHHAVFFSVSGQGVYWLRSLMYHYELHGGYAMALFELAASLIIYLWSMKRSNVELKSYSSIAVGGLIVIALITIALGTYSNRLTIYTAPVLAGLLAYLIYPKIKGKYFIYIMLLLLALGFTGLVFSGSTIYWDYSAGNEITWNSYSILYQFNYHYNLITYYASNWLTYYRVIELIHNINITKVFPYPGNLLDYNKNDLLYLANDIGLTSFENVLSQLHNSTLIIYNDGINIITVKT